MHKGKVRGRMIDFHEKKLIECARIKRHPIAWKVGNGDIRCEIKWVSPSECEIVNGGENLKDGDEMMIDFYNDPDS